MKRTWHPGRTSGIHAVAQIPLMCVQGLPGWAAEGTAEGAKDKVGPVAWGAASHRTCACNTPTFLNRSAKLVFESVMSSGLAPDSSSSA
eukprot:366237-Chlamydomonas_euryale.AAC.7